MVKFGEQLGLNRRMGEMKVAEVVIKDRPIGLLAVCAVSLQWSAPRFSLYSARILDQIKINSAFV